MIKPLMTEEEWNEWSAGVRECVMRPGVVEFKARGDEDWFKKWGWQKKLIDENEAQFSIYCIYRVRRRTITVNGYTVPAPDTNAPERGEHFSIPSASNRSWFSDQVWRGTEFDHENLNRGLVYTGPDRIEHAIIRARAMVGVDPCSQEQS